MNHNRLLFLGTMILAFLGILLGIITPPPVFAANHVQKKGISVVSSKKTVQKPKIIKKASPKISQKMNGTAQAKADAEARVLAGERAKAGAAAAKKQLEKEDAQAMAVVAAKKAQAIVPAKTNADSVSKPGVKSSPHKK
ncbi:MAG: hypothetical protein WCJ84_06275 [Candidatus Peregrinibacteria bacterium]